MKQEKHLDLTFVERDSWSRPVYNCDGRLYVDVTPLSRCKPEICTKAYNAFDGEPDTHIDESITVTFVPCRDVWR